MPRPLAAALSLLSAAALAAPAPNARPKDPVYFPTVVGAKWVYKFQGTEERVHTVTAVEQSADGATTVAVGWQKAGGKPEPHYRVVLAADGLYYLRAESAPAGPTPRACRIRLSLRVGDSWDGLDAPRKDGGTVTFRASGTERIKLPAEEFEALRLDGEDHLKTGEKVIHRTYWYAPGVGLVKSMVNGQEVLVLQSFTPGKE